jgi:hypothetical protein
MQAAGPLTTLDGQGAGDLWIVNANDPSEVDALVKEDPFWPTGFLPTLASLQDQSLRNSAPEPCSTPSPLKSDEVSLRAQSMSSQVNRFVASVRLHRAALDGCLLKEPIDAELGPPLPTCALQQVGSLSGVTRPSNRCSRHGSP